ncbi:hypothetical protein BU15DRAFT_66355 [Melanogaster broomeanus]|nr:hypothetical protein BU15DRAFT_66355 [Melanogaster broomeanus]
MAKVDLHPQLLNSSTLLTSRRDVCKSLVVKADITEGIACGKKNATVPWAKIVSNPDGLLHRKYLPADVYLKEPSKLKKLEVDKLLDFWKSQADRGVVPLFSFHHWMNWKGELMEPVETEVDGWCESLAGDHNRSADEAAADEDPDTDDPNADEEPDANEEPDADKEPDADEEPDTDKEPAGDGNDSANEAAADGEPHSGDDSDVAANIQPVHRSTPYPTKPQSTHRKKANMDKVTPASTSDKQHTADTISGVQARKSKKWHAADAAGEEQNNGPFKRQHRALDKQHMAGTVGNTAQAQQRALHDQSIIRRSGRARHPPKAPDEDVATPSPVKTKAKAHQRP